MTYTAPLMMLVPIAVFLLLKTLYLIFEAYRDSRAWETERDRRIKALRTQVDQLAPQIGALRRSVTLAAGESVVAPRRKTCSHWPRDEVKLADGTTVAYICRRCDHNWANEDYVRQGVDR